MDYRQLKELAKQRGCSVNDLCALAPRNDPFYVGRPADIRAAEWFADLWKSFGYRNGVHIRRMHYQLVSQDPRVELPSGLILNAGTDNETRTYINTEGCWNFLTEASKYARYMKLISPAAFVDRRNPEAKEYAYWNNPGDWNYKNPTPRWNVTNGWTDEAEAYQLPELPTLPGLPDDLPTRPYFEIEGYHVQQGFHLEIWCEKSTMNDVLIPLCQRYRVNFVTGLGEMSITSVVMTLKRIREARRPARILYISDFDPAGLGMPISVSRKIEFFLTEEREEYGDLDIMLQPIALNLEQIREHQLPRVPVKDSDLRKANFEAAYGEGQVELDALEALYPGTLAGLVRQAISDWYDPTLDSRAEAAAKALKQHLDERKYEVREPYQDDLDELADRYRALQAEFEQVQTEFDELVAPLRDKVATYQAELDAIKTTGRRIYNNIYSDMQAVDVDVEQDEFALPTPNLPEIDQDDWLYASNRGYFEQLGYYKERRTNGNGH